VALSGLLAAIGVSHLVVTPPDGGQVVVWGGLPLAIAAIGLLLAAAAAGDGLSRRLAARRAARMASMFGPTGGRFRIGRTTPGRGAAGNAGRARQVEGSSGLGGRGVVGLIIALAASSAPVLAAAWWVTTGVRGPVHPVTSQVVPELVAVGQGHGQQVRTLVLSSGRGSVSYLLLRGPSPGLADTSLSPAPAARLALARAVAVLIAPGGSKAVNLSRTLAEFDIGYILVQAPVDPQLAAVLGHEIGHYLLRSRQHASGGLMRASHRSPELIAPERDGFDLSAEEVAKITEVATLSHE